MLGSSGGSGVSVGQGADQVTVPDPTGDGPVGADDRYRAGALVEFVQHVA